MTKLTGHDKFEMHIKNTNTVTVKNVNENIICYQYLERNNSVKILTSNK